MKAVLITTGEAGVFIKPPKFFQLEKEDFLNALKEGRVKTDHLYTYSAVMDSWICSTLFVYHYGERRLLFHAIVFEDGVRIHPLEDGKWAESNY